MNAVVLLDLGKTVIRLLGILAAVGISFFSVTEASAAVSIVITTVPTIEGARFQVNGSVVVTNRDGIVEVNVPEPGTYVVKALEFEYQDPDVQADFDRWCCVVDIKTPEVQVPVGRSGQELQAGYQLSYLIDAGFHDPSGRPVDSTKIEHIRIKNDKGLRIELDSWVPQWLLGLGTTRVKSGLVTTEVRYRLDEVLVSGSNVVNSGQQSLLPSQSRFWDIELLFYDLNVSVSDYIFGHAVGDKIALVLPNGEESHYQLVNGHAFVESLPRGAYQIGVKGLGITLMQPLALSQDQNAELDYLSYLDVFSGLTIGFLCVMLLIVIGRPHLGALPIRKMIEVKERFGS